MTVRRTAQSTGRPGRSRMRLWALRAALGLFAALPLRLAHGLGAALGWLAWVSRSRLRRIAEENIARCLPELNAEEQTRLVRQHLLETGKTLTELGLIWRGSKPRIDRLVRGIHGKAHLDTALAAGKGCILLAPHSGSWEFGGLYTATLTPMSTIYRPPREPAFERLMTQGRTRFGAQLVPADRRGVKALFLALQRGELVAILPDQEPGVGEGAFAPFFGQPAYTVTLIHQLLQKTGARAVFGRTERLPQGRGYVLNYYPAPEALYDADVTISLTALNAAVEQIARENPAQYQWSYRRFRRQPPPPAVSGTDPADPGSPS
ncbi:lysophospholipid acyltransferase family protein [Halothiobacillus sp. DCM-1]|uniref:lysophospholipid acyltransferase family protein n=1 Tax=Halothiobacillus sp. DCM-1 TaxID=3112558 RepID=UPI003247A04F